MKKSQEENINWEEIENNLKHALLEGFRTAREEAEQELDSEELTEDENGYVTLY